MVVYNVDATLVTCIAPGTAGILQGMQPGATQGALVPVANVAQPLQPKSLQTPW